MSFDWRAYLTLAEELQGGTDEAKLRSAVSRAYYAAYNLALSTIMQVDSQFYPSKGGDSHAQVWRWFGQRSDSPSKAIANHAERLKKARVDADYRGAVAVLSRDAEYAVGKARTIAKQLSLIGP